MRTRGSLSAREEAQIRAIMKQASLSSSLSTPQLSLLEATREGSGLFLTIMRGNLSVSGKTQGLTTRLSSRAARRGRERGKEWRGK